LTEYVVFHHRPFIIKHSDKNKHYVIYRRGCQFVLGMKKMAALVEQLLEQSIAKNPFVREPHLVFAQVYPKMERYGEAVAEAQAEQGLKLLLQWGTSWDKRMSWEGWVSWGRAMLIKAKHKD
jgi:hypothetical protein